MAGLVVAGLPWTAGDAPPLGRWWATWKVPRVSQCGSEAVRLRCLGPEVKGLSS
jgi:hypothetical protein